MWVGSRADVREANVFNSVLAKRKPCDGSVRKLSVALSHIAPVLRLDSASKPATVITSTAYRRESCLYRLLKLKLSIGLIGSRTFLNSSPVGRTVASIHAVSVAVCIGPRPVAWSSYLLSRRKPAPLPRNGAT